MRGLLIVILIFWVLPFLIKKIKEKGGQKQKTGSTPTRTTAQRQNPTVEMHRPAPSMTRRTPSVVQSAHRDFSAPEAPCIVCDQTGEDHFQRDKIRRIKQLDDWLKNGIIDRDEYRVMKDRYERGI